MIFKFVVNCSKEMINKQTCFWIELKSEEKILSIPEWTITGSSASLFRRDENNGTPPILSNGANVLQLGSEPPAIWTPEKATYTTVPTRSTTKLRTLAAEALAWLHSLHDSGKRGAEIKNVASISLLSNLIQKKKACKLGNWLELSWFWKFSLIFGLKMN